MHFGAYQSRAATEEFEGEPFFIVVKGHGYNGYLVLDGQAERAILKFVKNYNFIIGYATLRKYADAHPLAEPFLCTLKHLEPAPGTVPVYQYARALVEEPEDGDLYQFLFAYKHKRAFGDYEHQHDVGHRGMVGHKHVAFAFFQLLFARYAVRQAHAYQDNLCPQACEDKELRVGLFGKYGEYEQRRKYDDGYTHEDVKPYTPQGP